MRLALSQGSQIASQENKRWIKSERPNGGQTRSYRQENKRPVAAEVAANRDQQCHLGVPKPSVNRVMALTCTSYFRDSLRKARLKTRNMAQVVWGPRSALGCLNSYCPQRNSIAHCFRPTRTTKNHTYPVSLSLSSASMKADKLVPHVNSLHVSDKLLRITSWHCSLWDE